MIESRQHAPGFILVLTLVIMSIAIMMVTQFYQRGTVYAFFDRTMIQRQQAQQLALGGLALASSQLLTAYHEQKKEKASPPAQGMGEKKEDQQEELESPTKKMLGTLLPVLNVWQTFSLEQQRDGIAATVELCISCEDGKIDLNAWYEAFGPKADKKGEKKDVEKKESERQQPQQKNQKSSSDKDEPKPIEALFTAITSSLKGTNLQAAFEKFMKDRQYKVNDITELLTQKEFQEAFADRIFYQPPREGEPEQQKRPIYLMDLFTIFSGNTKLNPWVLSDAACALFGFTRAQPDQVAKRSKNAATLLKEFKPQMNLATSWDTVFKPLYGKEWNAISAATKKFLSEGGEPAMFSVLVYARVGAIEQRLYAIVHRSNGSEKAELITRRLYWI